MDSTQSSRWRRILATHFKQKRAQKSTFQLPTTDCGCTLWVVIASTIFGSQIAFLIARRYGRDFIYKVASSEILERWDGIARHQGILFYFFSFVLPIFPSDLMCYVAGLSTISARRFLIANILGRTCCAVFITLIGIYGMHPPVWFWVVAIVAISAFSAGWVIYKKLAINALQAI